MCSGECAICALGGGGCLTAMYENNYVPASRKQVEKRLENGEYSQYRDLMIDYISKIPVLEEPEIDKLLEVMRVTDQECCNESKNISQKCSKYRRIAKQEGW